MQRNQPHNCMTGSYLNAVSFIETKYIWIHLLKLYEYCYGIIIPTYLQTPLYLSSLPEDLHKVWHMATPLLLKYAYSNVNGMVT